MPSSKRDRRPAVGRPDTKKRTYSGEDQAAVPADAEESSCLLLAGAAGASTPLYHGRAEQAREITAWEDEDENGASEDAVYEFGSSLRCHFHILLPKYFGRRKHLGVVGVREDEDEDGASEDAVYEALLDQRSRGHHAAAGAMGAGGHLRGSSSQQEDTPAVVVSGGVLLNKKRTQDEFYFQRKQTVACSSSTATHKNAVCFAQLPGATRAACGSTTSRDEAAPFAAGGSSEMNMQNLNDTTAKRSPLWVMVLMGGLVSMWLSTMYVLPALEEEMKSFTTPGDEGKSTRSAIEMLYLISFLGMGFGVLPGWLVDVLGPSLTTAICSLYLVLGMAGVGSGLLMQSPAILYVAAFLYGNGSKGICLGTLCVMMRALPSETYSTIAGLFMMLDAFSGITFNLFYKGYKAIPGVANPAATWFFVSGVFIGLLGLGAAFSYWTLYERQKRLEEQDKAEVELAATEEDEYDDENPAPPNFSLDKNLRTSSFSDLHDAAVKNKEEQILNPKTAVASSNQEDKNDVSASKKKTKTTVEDDDSEKFPKGHMLLGTVCLAFVMFFGTAWGMCYNKQVKYMYEPAVRADNGLLTKADLLSLSRRAEKPLFSLLRSNAQYQYRYPVSPDLVDAKFSDLFLWEWKVVPEDHTPDNPVPFADGTNTKLLPLVARFDSYAADRDVLIAQVRYFNDADTVALRSVEIGLNNFSSDENVLYIEPKIHSTGGLRKWERTEGVAAGSQDAFTEKAFDLALPTTIFIASNGIGRFLAGFAAESVGKCTALAIYFPVALVVYLAVFFWQGFVGGFPSSLAGMISTTIIVGLAFGAQFAMMPIYLKTVVRPANMGLLFGTAVLALVTGNFVWNLLPYASEDTSIVWSIANVRQDYPNDVEQLLQRQSDPVHGPYTQFFNENGKVNGTCVGPYCLREFFQFAFFLTLLSFPFSLVMLGAHLSLRRQRKEREQQLALMLQEEEEEEKKTAET
ncbi:unnamed protein product [Amoebophrya sp. A120]|nr:unnamed protein product [Amoebophrya sp. A120]|eukprot:GSA120T00020893001.1